MRATDGRSFVKVGRWKNTLVVARSLSQKPKAETEAEGETLAERRERGNVEAWGGLRFAKRAVSRSTQLRNVAERLRSVLDS